MLIVSEIFKSIQGESSFAGLPCVFIRLAGCNLRCPYCDTAYAQAEDAGAEMSIEDILDKIGEYKCSLIEVTGGEPLLQKETTGLIEELRVAGYKVLVETNGSQYIGTVSPWCSVIMDIKCPSSGHVSQMRWQNLTVLKDEDQIKFVIANENDYGWACQIIKSQLGSFHGEILMSPVIGSMEPKKFAEMILEDNLEVRMQLQIHKLIWPPEQRGV